MDKTKPNPIGPYRPNQYFAFVESYDVSEELSIRRVRSNRRGRYSLFFYTMWLDCINAQYFAELDWRDDSCEINNPSDSKRRRTLIQDLDASKFSVARIDGSSSGLGIPGELAVFGESAWHLVDFETPEGIAAQVGTDFDLEGAAELFIQHDRFPSDYELASLKNVFNLDFLPDADLDGRERPENEPPPRPPPTSGRPKKKLLELEFEPRKRSIKKNRNIRYG